MNEQTEYHSCYDELLTMLFNNIQSKNNTKYLKLLNTNGDVTNLTACEILIYSLLLHNCIENNSNNGTISYLELQKLRNKRIGKTKVLDIDTYNAFNKALYGLSSKYVDYDLKSCRLKKKITYRKFKHNLVKIRILETSNNNRKLIYTLGPFGKTLLESKRYSTLVPNKYFHIKFKEIMKYELALYVCKLLYLERRKKKGTVCIKLSSIMKNINKYKLSNGDLVKVCNCFDYKGPNIQRLWRLNIDYANELFEQLKTEYKIKDYHVQKLNIINNYKDIQWKVIFDK